MHYSPGEYVPDLVTCLRQPTLQTPEALRVRPRVLELGRAIIAMHRNIAVGERQPDFVDDLLDNFSKSGTIDHETIDEVLPLEVLNPILAGTDTVSGNAYMVLYTLLTHQEVLERVMAEIDAVLPVKELSWEYLKTMPSLHAAMMETLRLYPFTTGHLCQALQPFTFAGYRVEQGEEVFVAIAVSHFLPELFPEPERFEIERYRDPRNEHLQLGAYAPFGVGDRSCVGRGVAEIQLMVIIASLLSLFQLTLDPALAGCSESDFTVRVVARRQFSIL
jgi:cytochrome P450